MKMHPYLTLKSSTVWSAVLLGAWFIFGAACWAQTAVTTAGDATVPATTTTTVVSDETTDESFPQYYFTTLAGAWSLGHVDGSVAAARFNRPEGIALDAAGNLYVADAGNSAVRKITPDGMVSTLAGYPGNDTTTDIDGTLADARFRNVRDVAVDRSGVIYVAESMSIRRIGLDEQVTTLAGYTGEWPIGYPYADAIDGIGTEARFGSLRGLTVDAAGILYATDYGANSVRQITPAGVVTTLAGSGSQGSADGTGSEASFDGPMGLVVDSGGNVLVGDSWGNTIRKNTPTGVVTTLAGQAYQSGAVDGVGAEARFYHPSGVAVNQQGNLVVADQYNQTIRKVTPSGLVTTLAGNPISNPPNLIHGGMIGANDGVGSAATFNFPGGLAVDAIGNIYVADVGNNAIRKVTPAGVVSTVAGFAPSRVTGFADGIGSSVRFHGPKGLAVGPTGICYVADTTNQVIRQVTADGTVTTLAGQPGEAGYADGQGTAARFKNPNAVAVDASGNIYVADSGNYVIRKITPDGLVSTVAGQPGVPGDTDGAVANATLGYFRGLAVDASGNLYGLESRRVRRIGIDGQVTSLVPNINLHPHLGLGGIAVDGAGNVYASDLTYQRIIKFTPDGVEHEVAFGGFSPARIAFDPDGRLFVLSQDGDQLGVVQADGIIAVIVGDANYAGHIDGLADAVRLMSVTDITFDNAGDLYLVSGSAFDTTVRIGIPAAAPEILTQPVSVSVSAGSSASFSVTAAAVPEPTYQWYRDGTAISGATAATLSLSGVNTGNAGSYTVMVTNELGNVTSDAATLTVTSSTSGGSGGSTSSGGSGGGGGAPSWWFVAGLVILVLGRAVRSRRLKRYAIDSVA